MKKSKAIMLQGTCSNAGKSVLTAALCRILLQDGMRVAPFKAQNMSLNSFVTRDGKEMGRAQVVQAQAALLDPDVRMNPVLLKPASDVGCQVIVNGKPIGNQSVDQYIDYKRIAWEAVCNAYDSLSSEYDCIILEGAGSPAEVNLKHHDIVNMKMAQYAGAPVLLTGDIDRGGVFASFVGTMEVFDQWERDLVAGYVVNKFRGDASLLADAYEYMRKRTGKSVVGTIPYVQNMGIPEEDSVGFKAGMYQSAAPTEDHVVIGLIDLPHISNFTDIEPFLAEPDVHVRILKSPAEVAEENSFDAFIIPGSKNVIHDLAYLKRSGFAEFLKESAERTDVNIVGICGGFQMLGKTIADPLGLESKCENVMGLGLLDIDTELKPEKTLVRQEFTHIASGLKVFGYEIHHGESIASGSEILEHATGEKCGSLKGKTWGSYLHGIFDSDVFRRWFIDQLRTRKGYEPVGKILAPYDLEPAFDRLADTVRRNLDMDFIYNLI